MRALRPCGILRRKEREQENATEERGDYEGT